GPAAIRIAELHQKLAVLGFDIHDAGDLEVPVRDTLPPSSVANRYLNEIAQVCDNLHECVHDALVAGRVPIVLGADHCLAIGSIEGSARCHRERGAQPGLVWVDAHADMNTPTSSVSGNIHGMPLSVALGDGHPLLTSIGGDGAKLSPQNV